MLGAIVSSPQGLAEVEDAVALFQGVRTSHGAATVGADKSYDTALFVDGACALVVMPHEPAKKTGGAIDGRTTRHERYAVSQRKRKAIEEVFGWLKMVAGPRKLKHRGTALVDWLLTFVSPNTQNRPPRNP